jgi:hypothetical protein
VIYGVPIAALKEGEGPEVVRILALEQADRGVEVLPAYAVRPDERVDILFPGPCCLGARNHALGHILDVGIRELLDQELADLNFVAGPDQPHLHVRAGIERRNHHRALIEQIENNVIGRYHDEHNRTSRLDHGTEHELGLTRIIGRAAVATLALYGEDYSLRRLAIHIGCLQQQFVGLSDGYAGP